MNRSENIQRLRQQEFDLCIIGGGASGAGCALDAALRGLKVALIEKDDFAAGTSSKSTKLVHGGVRYLEQAFKKFDFAQLRQVRHGLEERHIVLQNAPQLARPLALVTPVFSWWEGLYFSFGLKLYDWFASGKDTLPKSRWLTKSQALRRMPGLTRKIHSAVLYYDGQLDDARYCLALVQSAAEAGAIVANHLEVIDFQKNENGNLAAAQVCDRLSREKFAVRAKLFLNCTGPFADHIRLLANPKLTPRLRPSKGVHVMLPHATLGSDDALLIPKTKDGRVVFAIPFEGELLLGTTDDDYSALEKEPVLEAAEVGFLLETLQPFVAQKIEKEQVKAGFGGLRPLVAPPSPPHGGEKPSALGLFNTLIEKGQSGFFNALNEKSRSFLAKHIARTTGRALLPSVGGQGGGDATSSLLRDHEVEHDPASNLLSLLGGKWTTYRLMAKDAINVACNLLGTPAECGTEAQRLVGAEGWDVDFWKKIQTLYGLKPDIAQHLAQKYGTRAAVLATLAAENPEWAERLLRGFPFLKAEIVYAAREEMACTLRDFLARRIRLEITDWAAAIAAAPESARLMGGELGWSPERQQQELEEYVALVRAFRRRAAGE